jgi:hypothetical protein
MVLGFPAMFKYLGDELAEKELMSDLLDILDDEEPEVKAASI